MIDKNEIDEIARFALTLEPCEETVDKAWGYVVALSTTKEKDPNFIKSNNTSVSVNYTKYNEIDDLLFQQVLHDAIIVAQVEKKFRNQQPTKKLMHVYIDCLNQYDVSVSSFIKAEEKHQQIESKIER